MSSYQERQLLCGLNLQSSCLGFTTSPLRPVGCARNTARRRWTTYDVAVVVSFSLMSAILSWKLSISENIVLYNCALKHPKTIHLSTPLCKGHNCSTVQHNFIYDGHVNPSFSQSATQPAIQSASRSAAQP